MPDGALNITLSDVVLSSTSVLSGTILHAIIGDPTLSALVSVLSGARLESRLDGASLSGDASVIAEASLSATIGSVSGQAFSVVRDGSTAPYEDVLSWTGHPLTGSRVRVRTGNLFGIFGELNEFGIFAGEGWDENSGTIPAWDSKYIRLGSFTNEFHNIPVKLYDDGDVTIQLEPEAPSFAMGNPIPSTYGTGIGLWQGKDSDDVYKWRVGDPSVGGSMLSWNGSSLSLVNSSLDIGGATAHIAFGNPPPTSPTSGTGIWIDRTGFYGVNAGVTQIFIDTLDGILYIDGGTEFGVNPLLGDLYVDGILTLGTDGRLQQGTGTWGVDFTGSAIWNESDVMMVGGWNDNVKQWWGGSDGKLYAGGGDVILDDDGLTIITPQYSGVPSSDIKFNYNNWDFYTISGYNRGTQVTHTFHDKSGSPMIWYDQMINDGDSSITYDKMLWRQDIFDNTWVARDKFQLGGVNDTFFTYYINGKKSSDWDYKAGINGLIERDDGISELLLETTNDDASYTNKQASILVQANVKTPSSKIDLTADSINVIGNADISGNLVVEGTIKDGNGVAYLKSTGKAADSDKLDGLDSTAFLQTPSWTSWTPTQTGWTALPTGTYRYFQVGKMCFFAIDITAGTSNGTSATLTLPFTVKSGVWYGGVNGMCMDNGTVLSVATKWYIDSVLSRIQFGTDMGGGPFTASGTKRMRCEGFYEIA